MSDSAWTVQKITKSVLGAVVGLFILGMLLGAYVVIPAGHTGILIRMGSIQPEHMPGGLHFKIPYTDDVDIYDCTVQMYTVETSAGSKDLQQVTTSVAVNYKFTRSKVPLIRDEVMPGLFDVDILAPAMHESIKSIVARYNAEELLTQRAQVKAEMETILQTKLDNVVDGAFIVVAVNITDFDFSNKFNTAIEAKQVAEQEAQQARNEVVREAAEADKKIEQARGRAESLERESMAEANAIRAIADARAHAITAEAAALADNPQLIELRRIERWDGTLPRYVLGEGSNVLFGMDGE